MEESGLTIRFFNTTLLPMWKFARQAKRIQYMAGNPAMAARLRAVIGR